MNYRAFFCVPGALAVFSLAPLAVAQTGAEGVAPTEVDASDLNRQLIERQEKIDKLSPEEREALRAAREKAVKDPAVLAAREKRDQAIRNFQAAVRAGVLKADPTLAPILEKTIKNPHDNPKKNPPPIKAGPAPGF